MSNKNKNIQIEVQGVKITLTDDQLKQIKLQTEEDIFTANTYSKVCTRLKEKEYTLRDFSSFTKSDQPKLLAFAKIKQLERYFNQNWTVNWKNTNQYKYRPYFESRGSGLVFDGSIDCLWNFNAAVGFFKDKETSDFVGKTFIDIYKDLI